MSTNLFWRKPPEDPPPAGSANGTTKSIVARALWDGDGSLRHEPAVIVRGGEVFNYLRGARDVVLNGDVREELSELLAVAEQHGAVEVWTE